VSRTVKTTFGNALQQKLVGTSLQDLRNAAVVDKLLAIVMCQAAGVLYAL